MSDWLPLLFAAICILAMVLKDVTHKHITVISLERLAGGEGTRGEVLIERRFPRLKRLEVWWYGSYTGWVRDDGYQAGDGQIPKALRRQGEKDRVFDQLQELRALFARQK